MFDQGYAVYENVLSGKQCQSLISDLADRNAFHGAGKRHLMSYRPIADLASNPRLLGICRELTGQSLVPYKATLFNKTGKANWLVAWHQDTALPIEREVSADGWGPCSIKEGVVFSHAPTDVLNEILALRINLDPSTPTNGPLRVIPGSHRDRISDDVVFRKLVDNGPQVEVTADRGGVIAMRPLLVHASSKCVNDDPRRVLHIEYAPTLQIAEGIALAKA